MNMQARQISLVLSLFFIAAIGIIAFHPVAQGDSTAARLLSIVEQSVAAQAVHGAVMAILLVMGVAMIGFSQSLGIGRVSVRSALTAFMLAIVMSFCAMTVDGFVIPAIGQKCVSASQDCLAETMTMLNIAAIMVQMFTKIALFLIAGATALWSIAMRNRDRQYRIVAGIGVASACAQIALLFGPAAYLTPHSLIMVFTAQSFWFFGLVWLVGFHGLPEGSDGTGIEVTD